MAVVEPLLTQHLDLWTAAIKNKSTAGRGSSKKIELYGIKKLRELILELAVRGLLVPQDPNDEPASELLKKIAAEKARLIKEGKIKKEKPLPQIKADSIPHSIPKGWAWCWLGDIQNFTNGFAFKSTDLHDAPGIGVIKIGDVYREKGVMEDKMQFIHPDLAESIEEKFLVHPGDMVITMTGDVKIGFNGTKNKYYLNQRVGKIECLLVNSKYVYLHLVTIAQSKIEEASGGVIPNVSTAEINATLVPLPPLPEQRRIVAKVDELMALCDQLERQAEAGLAAHQMLVATLLSALTGAAGHHQFSSAWQRIAAHFDTLFTTEQSLNLLKQTILQLAVMGKLVPQDPNDEPASVLLKKIATEKAKLVKAGKIKKEKPLPPITEEEKPFALPRGWEWAALSQVYDVRDGTHDTPKYWDQGFPLVTSKNLSSGKLDLRDVKYISIEDHNKIKERSKVDRNDILFAMIGSIGNAVIVDSDIEFSIKNVALFKYVDPSISSPKFLLNFLLYAEIIFREEASGAVQSFVSLGKIRSTLMALPPLAEQHRIVAKVDELMALCDQLKARLNHAQTTQLQLADAVLANALVSDEIWLADRGA